MRLAVIPARGGSKRIPRKNIREFCGKPIIGYSIEAALNSRLFDHVVVSTDDDEIADVAKSFGAEIPFVRPQHLSGDFSGTLPVIGHAINAMHKLGTRVDQVCCIYATAPFIKIQDLKRGLDIFVKTQSDYAFSATSFGYPIHRAFMVGPDGRIAMFQPEHYRKRSQDLPEAYHDAGQFYWGKPEAFLSDQPVFSERSVAVLLPRHLVQDIDCLEDWERAELMFKAYHLHPSE